NQKTFIRYGHAEAADLNRLVDATDKSLLLLFFRKEVLSCLFSLSPNLSGYLFFLKKRRIFLTLY
ncbi:MAG TPA: hypothetical protein VMB71_07680, partial [Acetobacteraceae bacterium]|nr:hypothetical protein [Acetobacteraceae bacterium]